MVAIGAVAPLTAGVVDQFGAPSTSGAGVTWTVSGDGSIDGSGNFTAGNVSGSAIVTATSGSVSGTSTVTVASMPNPVVTVGTTSAQWLEPTGGATVSGVVLCRVAANDPGGIASVTFVVDGTDVSTVTGPSYEMRWDSTHLADGVHALAARATSSSGTQVLAPLSITVHNGSLSAQSGCSATGGGLPWLWPLAALAFAVRRSRRAPVAERSPLFR